MEEIEFPKGTPMWKIKEAEHEFKKDNLAKSFGVEREKIDQWINEFKEYCECNKKKLLKRE